MLPCGMDIKIQACTSERAAGTPTGPEQAKSFPGFWRPWLTTNKDLAEATHGSAVSSAMKTGKGALGFEHPVRLCMPKSRIQEYLSHLGRTVLANFPVQATLHFYNDDSSSGEDEEDEEQDHARHRS